MVTSELQSVAAISDFLEQERVANAYPLGYLDRSYAAECSWYGASHDDELRAVVLVYSGLSRPGVFSAGDAAGVAAIVRDFAHAMPERATAHVAPDHQGALHHSFRERTPLRRMHRMALRREDFRDDGRDTSGVARLSHADTAAIMQLYGVWPDHFFEPYQLGSGLYFGVREGTRLVSIAGIHNVSLSADVAAIGNLVTHPDARGRGYALQCTSMLLREVFARVSLVTLDVEHGNEPAIRTYRHFGFYHDSDFLEGEVYRP
jgi:ribosomal protein S18 acetylase RimI-like enzyme